MFYRPEREAQILARLKRENRAAVGSSTWRGCSGRVISCCLNLEQPLMIAYLGPPGTYTEAAAIKQFGHFAGTRAMTSIDEVFREVESEGVHYGVVPVENSTEGMVNHTLDCFMESGLKICAEVELPIHHALMVDAKPAMPRSKRSILTPSRWRSAAAGLMPTIPGVRRTPVESNAEPHAGRRHAGLPRLPVTWPRSVTVCASWRAISKTGPTTKPGFW